MKKPARIRPFPTEAKHHQVELAFFCTDTLDVTDPHLIRLFNYKLTVQLVGSYFSFALLFSWFRPSTPITIV